MRHLEGIRLCVIGWKVVLVDEGVDLEVVCGTIDGDEMRCPGFLATLRNVAKSVLGFGGRGDLGFGGRCVSCGAAAVGLPNSHGKVMRENS